MFDPRALSNNGENGLRRLVLVRLIVSTAVFGAAIALLQIENRPQSMAVLYGLLGVMYLSTGSAFLAWMRGADARALVRMLVAIDMAVLALIAHFSGGLQSYFAILYILPIIVAGEYFQVAGGLAASLAATWIYIIYAILEVGGAVRPPAGVWTAAGTPGIPAVILRGYLQIAVFILTGLASGYVSRRMQCKRAEIACKDSELRQMRLDTDSILRNMSSGLIVAGADGAVLTCNPAALSILGIPGGALAPGRTVSQLLPHMPQLAAELSAVVRSGAQLLRHEIEIVRTDGTAVPIGISISLLREESGKVKGVIAIFQDLTEVREMRERIRFADRMAAVGELSAAIAHEVRAPLASICGSIEMLRGELEDLSGDNAELMDLILRESDRLDRIITDFLEFARMRRPALAPTDIGKCIDDIALMLRNTPDISRRVTVRVEAEPRQERILADEEQVRQVFLNLGINACEAVEGKGTLTISSATVMRRLCELRPEEECIEVRFHNDGPVIPADVLPHVFEPFYTTKEGGTGLGLAIAARIVESHGGLIRVSSLPGEGTDFAVVLPVCCRPADGDGEESGYKEEEEAYETPLMSV
ncbi:MAG: ATP-binding protein [Candidatus Krumholzibacteria bacterium]|nr:ATP-binding protein [Candidatus Krumholzibacteria bacterium]